MLTGSVASSALGDPRSTHDIDLVVSVLPGDASALLKAFPPPHYYLDESAIASAIQHRSMFNLLDTTAGDKVDFWILTDDPFRQSAFARRRPLDIAGLPVMTSTPEDLILAKLHWAKESGGSEKQFNDALGVYELQFPTLDLDYIRKWAAQLQVQDLWQRLQSQAEPL